MVQELKTKEVKGKEYIMLSEKDLISRYENGKRDEMGYIVLDGISGSTPIFIDGTGNELSGANLQHIYLPEAYLYYRNFSGADLRGACLRDVYAQNLQANKANLEGAILERAILVGSNFQGTKLYGADLQGANLSLASLYKAQDLDSAIFDKSTTFKECSLTPKQARLLNQITLYYQQNQVN